MKYKVLGIFLLVILVLIGVTIFKISNAIPNVELFSKYWDKDSNIMIGNAMYKNNNYISQFYELNMNKNIYKVSKKEALDDLSNKILSFSYSDKDHRVFSVSEKGSVYISISKSWLAGSSVLNSLWWKFIDNNDPGVIYYRTESDTEMTDLAKQIKRDIDSGTTK